MPALWLKGHEQQDKARQLIEDYQQWRQNKVREEYRLNRRTIGDMFKENPVRYISYIVVIVFLCYFMVFLFLTL